MRKVKRKIDVLKITQTRKHRMRKGKNGTEKGYTSWF